MKKQPPKQTNNYVSFRQLTEHIQTAMYARPQRMIDLEGLPLCASPRLQFGREWFGEIEDHQTNFVNRFQNCRYLIDISGVRRFLSFEDGTNDSTKNDIFHTNTTVQCFIDEERRAWTCACMIWHEQRQLLYLHPQNNTHATHDQLLQLFTKKSALFRYGSFDRKYLATLFVQSSSIQHSNNISIPKINDFCNIPIIDYTAPDKRQVFRILSASQFFSQYARGKVFVHCAGGWGRTGMALLLLTMALLQNQNTHPYQTTHKRMTQKQRRRNRTRTHSSSSIPTNRALSWESAMQLMLCRYKRQSIAEVWHLLHMSNENQRYWKQMEKLLQERPSKNNAMTLWNRWKTIVSSSTTHLYQQRIDQGEPIKDIVMEVWKMSHIKFDVNRAGKTNTVTYHARNIPLFESWINAFFLERSAKSDAHTLYQRRHRALAIGRPIYAPVTQDEYKQRLEDDTDNVRDYVLMREKIHKLYKEMTQTQTQTDVIIKD